jgi:hypothetical protein
MEPAPTPAEFRERARVAFAFLFDEYECREESIPAADQNPVAVWVANDTTRVIVEGINHGANARVALGHTGPPDAFENIDLTTWPRSAPLDSH